MISTLAKMERYQTWSRTRSNYINVFQNARKRMLKQIQTIKQSDLNTAALMYEQLIKSTQFSENKITTQILNRMQSVTDRAISQGLQQARIVETPDGKIPSPFQITSTASKQNWAKYYSALSEFKSSYSGPKEELSKAIKNNAKLNELKGAALSAQGQINKVQGDLFEIFLQNLELHLTEEMQNFTEEELNSIVSDFTKSINNPSFSISTAGSKGRKIEVKFGNENITITSQQKTDAIIKSPFATDEDWNISAKNYGKSSDISLLSKANVLGMVSEWPMGQDPKIFYLNSLSVYSPKPEDIWLQGQMLLSIQALVGTTFQSQSMHPEPLSNVLAVLIRSSKHPVRFLSTGTILQQVTEQDLDSYFSIKFAPELPLFKGGKGDERTREEYASRVRNLHVTIKLLKQKLYLHYLRKLT